MSHYKEYEVTDHTLLFNFIQQYPFAMIVRNGDEYPSVVHAPVLIKSKTQLEFHIANSNELYADFIQGGNTKFVFRGPNAYISPSWYKERFKDGDRSKTAPTWDYTMVEVKGNIAPLSNSELIYHLDRLVTHFERSIQNRWQFDEIDPEFLERLHHMITGFSVEVESVSGRFKVSQEQSAEDQKYIIEALNADEHTKALAKFMERGL